MNAEICALYTSINNFCRANGVSQFGAHNVEVTQSALRVFLDDVNAVSKKKRRIDAMHKLLFDLATEAAAMRTRREKGGLVVEIKPLHAIILSKFPSGDASSTPARAIARTARKRQVWSDEDDEANSIEMGSVQRRLKTACLDLLEIYSVCTMRCPVFGSINNGCGHSQSLSELLSRYTYCHSE